MNSSDSTTVNKSNNYNLTDADLAALFVSSIVSTTPSNTLILIIRMKYHNNNNNNTLDDVFLQSS